MRPPGNIEPGTGEVKFVAESAALPLSGVKLVFQLSHSFVGRVKGLLRLFEIVLRAFKRFGGGHCDCPPGELSNSSSSWLGSFIAG